MQTKHLCVLIPIWTKSEAGAPWNWFKPSSKIFLLTVPRRCFFCGSFMLFLSCLLLCFMHVCLLMPCTHLLGKGLISWLSFVMSNSDVATFPLVSWVRCGAWLYWFLTCALSLTFSLTIYQYQNRMKIYCSAVFTILLNDKHICETQLLV